MNFEFEPFASGANGNETTRSEIGPAAEMPSAQCGVGLRPKRGDSVCAGATGCLAASRPPALQ